MTRLMWKFPPCRGSIRTLEGAYMRSLQAKASTREDFRYKRIPISTYSLGLLNRTYQATGWSR